MNIFDFTKELESLGFEQSFPHVNFYTKNGEGFCLRVNYCHNVGKEKVEDAGFGGTLGIKIDTVSSSVIYSKHQNALDFIKGYLSLSNYTTIN